MKRMLWIFLIMSCGATYVSSLFPLYGLTYQLSNFDITLLFAVYAVILVPTLLVVGARGNYWGLKKVLRTSIWLSLVSTLLFAGSQYVWMLYLARAIEGVAYGAFTGTATAFLLKQTSNSKISNAIKFSGVAVNVGFGLGPALSGVIAQYWHVQPLQLPFWILLVLLISCLWLLEKLPPHEESSQPKRGSVSLGVPAHIRSHFFSFIGLPAFTFFMLGGIVLSLIPSFVKNIFHSSNIFLAGLLTFILMGVAAIMQFFPWLRYPITRMRIGITLLAVGPWLIVYSGQSSNMALLWIGVLVQGIGAGWTFQSALRFASELPQPKERPRVISAFYLCAYSGFILPPIGVGVLTQFFSLNVSLILLNSSAALIVIYILLYSNKFGPYYSEATSNLNTTG